MDCGGAVSVQALGGVTIEGCSLVGCQSRCDSPGGGGAVWALNGSVSIRDSTSVDDSSTSGNEGSGGAICVFNTSMIMISNCTFVNTACGLGGGAISIQSELNNQGDVAMVTISECTLTNTTAAAFGGAIGISVGAHVYGGGHGLLPATISNCAALRVHEYNG
jgi:hypothetical protein